MQFPAIFLLDGDGVIRVKPNHQSDTLPKLIEDLMEEINGKSNH
jgi:hypothetical protein